MEPSARRRDKPSSSRLSSVANAMRLAKAFDDEHPELGISALAARLGLAKSTVHRLASTLVAYDFLEQNRENGRYRPGLAFFELGMLVRRQMDVAKEARAFMRELRESTGETVQLAVLDGTRAIYVLVLDSPQAVRINANLGATVPIHCSGVGKALLAHQEESLRQQVAGAPLVRRTDNTITSGARLVEELAQVRARGYAVDDEEMEPGLRCIAAPIRNHNGSVVAAVSVAAPSQRLAKKAVPSSALAVVSAAQSISRQLGYAAPGPAIR